MQKCYAEEIFSIFGKKLPQAGQMWVFLLQYEPSLVPQMMSFNNESSQAGTFLLSPSSLLPSRSLNSLLTIPSALSVLYCLARKCVLHGRWELQGILLQLLICFTEHLCENGKQI